MSWKSGSNSTRRPWSLATYLTLWYSLSAFALVLVATGYLYWALANNLDREDDQFLADRVRSVMQALESSPKDQSAIDKAINGSGSQSEAGQIMIRVSDANGRILGESPGFGTLLPAQALPKLANDSVSEIRRDFESDAKRSYRLLVVRHSASGALIQSAMDRTHEAELLEDYRRHLSYILGLSLIACSIGGYVIAKRGMRPVNLVARMAERIGSSNLDERLELAGKPAEISNLAETFNNMLDRLKDSFARMGQYSADIAHELRTPIHNLRGEIEVAMGNLRTPAEYQEALSSLLEETNRLSRMIDSLLFLARAEQPKSMLNREPVDLGAELARVRDFFEAPATEARVKLELADGAGLNVNVDRTLMQRAIGNLVENALTHTPEGGSVALSVQEGGGEWTVTIADTGSGISPEHLPYLFDRFYRADRSRSARTGGAGLGLAIVKGIVELHGGKVEIASELGRGTRVTLRFPRDSTKSNS